MCTIDEEVCRLRSMFCKIIFLKNKNTNSAIAVSFIWKYFCCHCTVSERFLII